MNRWIVGLTIVALLAVGGVALAGGGFSGRGLRGQASCPATADVDCEPGTGIDGVAGCDNVDGGICPQDGSGCEEGAGTGLGLSENRPLDGSGAQCAGGGQGQRAGGCRGGRS